MNKRSTNKKFNAKNDIDNLYDEDFLLKDDDNEVKLDLRTKANIKDEFLESLDKLPKEQNHEKPLTARNDIQNRKKDNFFIENKEVKDLDKQ